MSDEDDSADSQYERAAPQMGLRAMETFPPLTAEDQPAPSTEETVEGDEWWFKFSDAPQVVGNAITYRAMNVSYLTAPAGSVTDSVTVTGSTAEGETVPAWTETVPVMDDVVGRQEYDRVVYLPTLPAGAYMALVELDVGRPDRSTNADVKFTVSPEGDTTQT